MSFTQDMSALIFLGLNGLVSVGIMFMIATNNWTIAGLSASTEPVQRSIAIGLGVPLLLRSKICSFGDHPGGPAILYELVRNKALQHMAASANKRRAQLVQHSAKLTAMVRQTQWIHFVNGQAGATVLERQEFITELANIESICATASAASERGPALITWLCRICGFRECKEVLADLHAEGEAYWRERISTVANEDWQEWAAASNLGAASMRSLEAALASPADARTEQILSWVIATFVYAARCPLLAPPVVIATPERPPQPADDGGRQPQHPLRAAGTFPPSNQRSPDHNPAAQYTLHPTPAVEPGKDTRRE